MGTSIRFRLCPPSDRADANQPDDPCKVTRHTTPLLMRPESEGPPLRTALLQVRFEAETRLVQPGGTSPGPGFPPALGVDSAEAARTLHTPRRRSRDGGNGRPPSGPAPPASQ